MFLPNGQTIKFDTLPISRRFDLDDIPFRERGDSHRELTFFELWDRMHPPDGREVEPRFATELRGDAPLSQSQSLLPTIIS